MFRRKQSRPQTPINYPSGLVVDTGSDLWYVRGNKRYRVYSDRTFKSWRFDTVARGSEQSLRGFETAGVLGFRDGSLLKNIANGKIYLVSGNKLRHIVTPDAFDKLGLDRSKIVLVADKEARLHDEGEPIEF